MTSFASESLVFIVPSFNRRASFASSEADQRVLDMKRHQHTGTVQAVLVAPIVMGEMQQGRRSGEAETACAGMYAEKTNASAT